MHFDKMYSGEYFTECICWFYCMSYF